MGDGHRPRDPRPAADGVQDVLRVLGRLRGAAQHQRVPRVSRPPGRAPRAQRAGREARRARGPRPRVHRAPAQRVRAQELFLSRPPQGLPDLAVRAAARHRREPRLPVARARRGRRHHRAAARGGGRGESLHDRFPKETAIDLNRCGVPLIEIVTGPDFRSPQEARAYLQTLKQVLEYAGVSDCDMEKGSLRVDANVSVRRAGAPALGTKTEVKNINSFAYVEKALTVERDRQIAVLEAGGTVTQQTLLYDARANAVRPQRAKEESHDYRYFPDPDLPPLVLDEAFIAEQQALLPELPGQKRERFVAQYTLSVADAAVLTADRAVADYYEAVVRAGAEPKAAANWVMGEVLADAKAHGEALRVPAASLAQIIALVKGGTLSHQAAKRVFAEVAERGGEPRTVAEALGLVQVADAGVLAAWVSEVLGAHRDEVARYKRGETKLLQFFVGQVMRASRGKADPKLAQKVLEEKLAS